MLAIVAVAQLWAAHRYFGFWTGDDVEVLAEAFRVAVAFKYRAWDIRNLFVPDFVVAPFVVIASRLGVHDPARLIEAATLPFIAANALTIWLVYRLTLRWTADSVAAIAAALLFALHWIPLAFASAVYPRTIATACIVCAAMLVTTRRSAMASFAAGLLVGVAFADRFSEIVFVAPLLIAASLTASAQTGASVPQEKRWIRVLALLAGAAISIALLAGAYDWFTWGTPFSSVRNFADVTIIHPDFASRAKYQSAWWYLANISRWCAPTLIIFFVWARRSTHARVAALFIAIPLLVLSIIRHKELRYLQAMIPFVAIAAGIGFAAMWRGRHRRWAAVLLAVSLGWNLAGVRYLARKSMPAVMAARVLGADRSTNTVAMSQLWAYGDRLYFTDRMSVIDVGEPPRHGDLAIASTLADAVALYESDLDDRALVPMLRSRGFAATQTFRDGEARAVVVYRKSR